MVLRLRYRLRLEGGFAVQRLPEVSPRAVECAKELPEALKAEVLHTAFNRPDVRAVEVREMCESLLRHAFLLSPFAQHAAERLSRVGVPIHSSYLPLRCPLFDILLVGGLLVSFNPLENVQMKRLLMVLVPSLLSAQAWARDSTKSPMDTRWSYGTQTVAQEAEGAMLLMRLGCDASNSELGIGLIFISNRPLAGTVERGARGLVTPIREKWDTAAPVSGLGSLLSDGRTFVRGTYGTEWLDALARAREYRVEVAPFRGARTTFRFTVGDSLPMAWLRERCRP